MASFSEELDLLLINSYNERKDIFDCNDRTIEANRKRKLAWNEIATVLNSNSENKRCIDQVQSRFKYLTAKAKRKQIEKKKYSMKTGGGPPLKESDRISEQLIDQNVDNPTYVGLEGYVSGNIEGEESTSAAVSVDKETDYMPAKKRMRTVNDPNTPKGGKDELRVLQKEALVGQIRANKATVEAMNKLSRFVDHMMNQQHQANPGFLDLLYNDN